MKAKKRIFNTSEAAYAVDRSGRIAIWNHAAERFFGYTESEALGKQCWALLAGTDIFGNQSCCEGCPIRSTAFDNGSVNSFQVDFETASHESKRITVITMMLFVESDEELLVHICLPESSANQGALTRKADHHSSVKNHKILTPKEIEVLTLLHKGMRIMEIATHLNISPATVRNHNQHIFFKLHAHTQLEAVTLGRRLGLI